MPGDIYNTDQGTQYTSEEFTGILKSQKIRISMDGLRRALDNVFVELIEHQSLDYNNPGEIYFGDIVLKKAA